MNVGEAVVKAVLYCASLSDEDEMTVEDARAFWAQLATYALDSAAEIDR